MEPRRRDGRHEFLRDGVVECFRTVTPRREQVSKVRKTQRENRVDPVRLWAWRLNGEVSEERRILNSVIQHEATAGNVFEDRLERDHSLPLPSPVELSRMLAMVRIVSRLEKCANRGVHELDTTYQVSGARSRATSDDSSVNQPRSCANHPSEGSA